MNLNNPARDSSSTWHWTLTALATAVLAACGGGGGAGDAPATPSSVISGAVVKGPVAGSQVCVYGLLPAGKGTLLGCTTTADDGSYSLSLGYSGDVIVEATGGSYTDEASGAANVSLSAPLAVAGSIVPGANVLIATPLTALAMNKALAGGDLTVARFESAALEVGTAFGLPGDLRLAQAMPVVTGSPNAYGKALVNVSEMIAAGAALSAVTLSVDFISLGATNQLLGSSLCKGGDLKVAQLAQVPSGNGVYLEEDESGGQQGLSFRISDPDAAWRMLLPDSGPAMGCKVTSNTSSAVEMTCPPVALAGGVTIIVTGSYEPVPAALPASGVLLAGNRIDGMGHLGDVSINVSSPLTQIGNVSLPPITLGGAIAITPGSGGLISPGTTISTSGGGVMAGAGNLTTKAPGGISGVILGGVGGKISLSGGACQLQTSPAAI